jgi:hypothetical protein
MGDKGGTSANYARLQKVRNWVSMTHEVYLFVGSWSFSVYVENAYVECYLLQLFLDAPTEIVSSLANVVRGSEEIDLVAKALALFLEEKKSHEVLRWCISDSVHASGTENSVLIAINHLRHSRSLQPLFTAFTLRKVL